MSYLDDFHLAAGRTIMNCQRIEHDLKITFAAMKRGDFKENYALVKNETLGFCIANLQELDCSDGSPYFSNGDYEFLRDINRFRNWLAHSAYREFMYAGKDFKIKYEECRRKLAVFDARLSSLVGTVEQVRIDVLRIYRGV